MSGFDRRTALCRQPAPARVTGIDFVQVVDPHDQHVLRVFFLIDPDTLAVPMVATAAMPVDASPALVTIVSISGGETLAAAVVVRATWMSVPTDAGPRTVLEVQVAEPGDFSIYRLTVQDARVDRWFNAVAFSFKQGCPSDLDCAPVTECREEDAPEPRIDYLARDFTSFGNALLDFAAANWPQWRERVPADAGVMLMELLAALGDEFSYIQDRAAREAYLDTATEGRSRRGLARLVDYRPDPGRSATTLLAIAVTAGGGFAAAGTPVWAVRESTPPLIFELGTSVADRLGGWQFWVQSAWNAIPLHPLDDTPDGRCLPVGATEAYLVGHVPTLGQLPVGDPSVDPANPGAFWIGKWVILRSTPADPSLPARRWLIQITAVEQTEDPLFLVDANGNPDPNGNPLDITRIAWDPAQALPFELCQDETALLGNIVPAIAGASGSEVFRIGAWTPAEPQAAALLPRAVERQGVYDAQSAGRRLVLRWSPRRTEAAGLAWLDPLTPDIVLREVEPAGGGFVPVPGADAWEYQPSLIDALPDAPVFTLEEGTWREIIRFERIGETIVHEDYASGAGFTLRFGDGAFGRAPPDGTLFEVLYRTGPAPGASLADANLAADSVTMLVEPGSQPPNQPLALASAVTNPLAITSGSDPEPPDTTRILAPEAWRARPLRAVRDEDYRAIAARELDWVQRAGAQARWTGSWLTEFVTADPEGAFALSEAHREELADLVDGIRQAGREAFVVDPDFISIDLDISICVQPGHYPGDVEQRVTEALTGRRRPHRKPAFFDPDNFTFGDPLRRSALEAAVQAVPGVHGVEQILIRARRITDWRPFDEPDFTIGANQIIRLQNDANLPERGSLAVHARTGA
ncbi:baseplate J/gp47 family protein [Limobrevibacterium gyesilva]|uniref:Baseplate assembly protein n=1 Tax=Limobrevibacterium gyesilva TaxID=2991712 RepID=A0AA41YKY6_9PROT|nr:hypothetical protein [Limobrevibacterium gyesilva]MCW3475299.1 hypothetical protein [Limobrevibacterium gyesilva]